MSDILYGLKVAKKPKKAGSLIDESYVTEKKSPRDCENDGQNPSKTPINISFNFVVN